MKINFFIITVIVTILLSSSVYAQKNYGVRYQREVLTGYSFAVGAYSSDRINFHFVQGMRFNPYVFAGLGVGLDWFYRWSDVVLMPLYLNVRGYMPVANRTSLYVSLDLGTGLGIAYGVTQLTGFMFTPAVGASYKINARHALNLSLGYNYQAWTGSQILVNTDALSLKLGLQF